MSEQSPSETAKDVAQTVSRKETAREVLREFGQDDVPGLAAEIAYHLIFSLAPLLIFIISVAAVVDQFTGVEVAQQLKELITENAPSESAQEVLSSLVDNAIANTAGRAASFGAISSLLLALWGGSNAVGALMKAFNRAYDVTEERPFLKKKLVALGLTILMGILVNVAFVLFVFGGAIGEWVAEWFGLGSAFNWAWNLARYPLSVIFIMFLLAVLYYLGPNINQSFVWISPGSVIATLLWIGLLFGFQFYLRISDPGSAYGIFGGLIVLLFFFYLTGMVFLIGAEINAVIGKQKDPEMIADLRRGRVEANSPESAGGFGNPGQRRSIVQPLGLHGPEVPHETSAKTKALALGAVAAATALMLGARVKGMLGR